MPNWLKLIISLLIPQLVGGLGAWATFTSVQSWYPTLAKPAFNPPNWIFGPMWTLIYVLMGIACFLIWKSKHPRKKQLLILYGVQLFFNALWSPAFFGLQSPGLGLLVIIPLFVLIVFCVIQFKKVSAPASWLMVPYLLWVGFASMLNFSIWMLN